MPVYLRTRSLFISLLLALYVQAVAQSLLPPEGGTERYAVSIEMPRGYISGISIMKNDGERMICSVFNEFGVSAMDFTYDLNRKKVKLLSVMNYIPLSCFQSAGLWSVLLDGSINAVGSGKTVSVYCRTLFK